MHFRIRSLLAVATVAVLPQLLAAQGAPAAEVSRAVEGGGISVKGWGGKVDANEEKRGMTINSAKFIPMGGGMHVTTGPATTYWNTSAKASGNYTVKATFSEAKFQNLNDHPHPYGIAIGVNNTESGAPTLLYCAAYGTGTFIVRGFGPAAFQMGGRNPTASDAVHKAAAKGEPVSQDIAVSVKDGKVSCSINGTVVATYDKAELVGEGKLKSLDGLAGLRFGHNTDVHVSNFAVTKN